MTTTIKTTKTPRRVSRLRLLLLALVLGSAIMLIFKEPPYTNIENDQLQVMLNKNIPIYDIRRPEEWQQTGVIEGSHLLTFIDTRGQIKPDFINRFTTEVDKDEPVILICRTGSRTSKLAHHLMTELGYTNIFNVDDGIKQWLREKRQVTQIIKPASDAYFGRRL
ncbi:hypothetical protein MNBD_GAMMA05-250 [hydrothermal vent metagenome]|uniref:Rhodanese domain-containing protein n=1 Tax=hydrothermal vent metagenome TaxID=652676 RepID=A0A3B0WR80_9ZZZZ